MAKSKDAGERKLFPDRKRKVFLTPAERIKLADYIRAEIQRDAKATARPLAEFAKGFAALTGCQHCNPGHVRRTFADLGIVHAGSRNGAAALAPAAGRIAGIEKALGRIFADLYGEQFPPA